MRLISVYQIANFGVIASGVAISANFSVTRPAQFDPMVYNVRAV